MHRATPHRRRGAGASQSRSNAHTIRFLAPRMCACWKLPSASTSTRRPRARSPRPWTRGTAVVGRDPPPAPWPGREVQRDRVPVPGHRAGGPPAGLRPDLEPALRRRGAVHVVGRPVRPRAPPRCRASRPSTSWRPCRVRVLPPRVFRVRSPGRARGSQWVHPRFPYPDAHLRPPSRQGLRPRSLRSCAIRRLPFGGTAPRIKYSILADGGC